jgi:hypothetical protein
MMAKRVAVPCEVLSLRQQMKEDIDLKRGGGGGWTKNWDASKK